VVPAPALLWALLCPFWKQAPYRGVRARRNLSSSHTAPRGEAKKTQLQGQRRKERVGGTNPEAE